ncbi:MAG: protein phosphatase 2C domain-containing protein [Capsulimonadaceae bacterium]
MKLTIGATTDCGRRSSNQDAYAVIDVATLGLRADAILIIADGMGGRNFGDQASLTAVEVVSEVLGEQLGPHAPGSLNINSAIAEALVRANETVYELSRRDPESEGMGTTCVVAIVADGRLHVGHAGDSRAYVIYNQHLEQITDDHSFVAEQVRAGVISEESARKSRFRNVITRAVGIDATLIPEVSEYPTEGVGAVLLCTDGLSNVVKPVDIERALLTQSAQPAADKLVKLAKQGGGTDNITAVVLRLGEGPVVTDPAQLQEDGLEDGDGTGGPRISALPGNTVTSIVAVLVFVLIILVAYLGGVLRQDGYVLKGSPPFIVKPTAQPVPVRDLSHLHYSAPTMFYPNPVRPDILLYSTGTTSLTAMALKEDDLICLDAADGTTLYQYPWSHFIGPARTAADDAKVSESLAPDRQTPANFHMTTDSQGNFYIANASAGTIVKFRSTGEKIGVIKSTADRQGIDNLCPQCGTNLLHPEALAVNETGDIYVIDGTTIKILRAVVDH